MNDYQSIGSFGQSAGHSAMTNPLTYCAVTTLDSNFNHTLGEDFGPDSEQCQRFMSEYCANNWDGVCEYVSKNVNTQYPNTVRNCGRGGTGSCMGSGIGGAFTQGEILIRNTAASKYLKAMANCQRKYQPFDPTVADSPLISYWEPNCHGNQGSCVPIYEVDPSKIDHDPVMNKILQKPVIAIDVLLNIYNNAVNFKKIHHLRHTKLYRLFMSQWFQTIAKGRGQAAAVNLY
jgi:hypothetical protein